VFLVKLHEVQRPFEGLFRCIQESQTRRRLLGLGERPVDRVNVPFESRTRVLAEVGLARR
jgi:hypothetical protein